MNITGATVVSTTRSSSGLGEQRSAKIKWTEGGQEQTLDLLELSDEHYEDLRAALAGGLVVDLVLDGTPPAPIAVTLRKP